MKVHLPLKGEAIEHLAESLKFQMPFKRLDSKVHFHSLRPKSAPHIEALRFFIEGLFATAVGPDLQTHSRVVPVNPVRSAFDSSNNTNDDDRLLLLSAKTDCNWGGDSNRTGRGTSGSHAKYAFAE